jgi:UDP-N-acetylmuramoyl-tripeptide--D-alanyl-D-alanine ligase
MNVFGLHNARNALAATACALAAGASLNSVAKGLALFQPVKGRLQVHHHEVCGVVIDDTYNANPDSVRAAIDVLAAKVGPKVLVLGDMGEVGNQGEAFHEEIGAYAKSSGVDLVFTVGQLSQRTTQAFGEGAVHYADVASLIEALRSVNAQAWLIKGSRFMKMEHVVDALLKTPVVEKHHEGVVGVVEVVLEVPTVATASVSSADVAVDEVQVVAPSVVTSTGPVQGGQ